MKKKKYWIVVHKPTMTAVYELGMLTSKYDDEEELKKSFEVNCWDPNDYVAVEIT